MADISGIIAEAAGTGIAIGQIAKKAGLPKSRLTEDLKRLREGQQIAGPYKFKNTEYYFARGYEPSAATTGRLVEAQIRDTGTKLRTERQVQVAVKRPFKDFFADGIRSLVGDGKLVILKGGNSKYLFHVDVARSLFPKFDSVTDAKNKPPAQFADQVRHAYDELKHEQGGLSAVSIGKLLARAGVSKSELHHYLLAEAHKGSVDLHPTTLVDLAPEDREGALSLPGKSEPAITVTFRE